MKPQYDFSQGERGKFFHPNASIHLPIYLDEEVQSYLQERALSKGIEMAHLVNTLLKHEIRLIEAVNNP